MTSLRLVNPESESPCLLEMALKGAGDGRHLLLVGEFTHDLAGQFFRAAVFCTGHQTGGREGQGKNEETSDLDPLEGALALLS